MDLELKCEVLPADVMVILLDEGGICVGIGLPPKPESNTTHHLPQDVSIKSPSKLSWLFMLMLELVFSFRPNNL
jgi:hypothetical protein